MYDIGVFHIVSIKRVHDTSSASAAFRVTINDYSIKHNVYNPKVYTNGIKAKPYRFYKQGTQIQDISKPILHNHQNHMTGSTVINTGKDNQRPNPSQFQQNRYRQSLRKGNNNRMWSIKPHTENQIESPLLSSASSDDNNKSHDSITCVPFNTRPVQLNACAVPYIPRTYNLYTALQHTQVCPSSILSGTYPYIPEMQPQVSQVQPHVPLMQPQQAQLMQPQNVPQLQQVPQMQRRCNNRYHRCNHNNYHRCNHYKYDRRNYKYHNSSHNYHRCNHNIPAQLNIPQWCTTIRIDNQRIEQYQQIHLFVIL